MRHLLVNILLVIAKEVTRFKWKKIPESNFDSRTAFSVYSLAVFSINPSIHNHKLSYPKLFVIAVWQTRACVGLSSLMIVRIYYKNNGQ